MHYSLKHYTGSTKPCSGAPTGQSYKKDVFYVNGNRVSAAWYREIELAAVRSDCFMTYTRADGRIVHCKEVLL